MALFDRTEENESHSFPTLPAFLVPVEVRECPQYGEGHCGVFALENIPKDTKFWMWTDRVKGIKSSELKQYITDTYGDAFVKSANISWKEYVARCDAIQLFLRHGFVLPEKDIFYTNPTDAGRFMNHSSNPNCGPDGTLRDIQSGEELTMDYSFHGNPIWY